MLENIIRSLNIVDWFDPHDIQHVQAYVTLGDSGHWPKGFIPKGMVFPIGWNSYLKDKIADAWLEHMMSTIRE